jgi:hypothetical protein
VFRIPGISYAVQYLLKPDQPTVQCVNQTQGYSTGGADRSAKSSTKGCPWSSRATCAAITDPTNVCGLLVFQWIFQPIYVFLISAPMHIMRNPNRAPASHAPRNGGVQGGLPPAPPPTITGVNGVPSYLATVRDQGALSLPIPPFPLGHQNTLRGMLLGGEASSSRSTQVSGYRGNAYHPYRQNHHVTTRARGRGIGAPGGRNDRATVAPRSSDVLPGRERGGPQRGPREGGKRKKGGRPPVPDPAILSMASPAAP